MKGGALTGQLVKNASTTFWTGGWRKPTSAEYSAMINNCRVGGTVTIDGTGSATVGSLEGLTDKTSLFVLGIGAAQ